MPDNTGISRLGAARAATAAAAGCSTCADGFSGRSAGALCAGCFVGRADCFVGRAGGFVGSGDCCVGRRDRFVGNTHLSVPHPSVQAERAKGGAACSRRQRRRKVDSANAASEGIAWPCMPPEPSARAGRFRRPPSRAVHGRAVRVFGICEDRLEGREQCDSGADLARGNNWRAW